MTEMMNDVSRVLSSRPPTSQQLITVSGQHQHQHQQQLQRPSTASRQLGLSGPSATAMATGSSKKSSGIITIPPHTLSVERRLCLDFTETASKHQQQKQEQRHSLQKAAPSSSPSFSSRVLVSGHQWRQCVTLERPPLVLDPATACFQSPPEPDEPEARRYQWVTRKFPIVIPDALRQLSSAAHQNKKSGNHNKDKQQHAATGFATLFDEDEQQQQQQQALPRNGRQRRRRYAGKQQPGQEAAAGGYAAAADGSSIAWTHPASNLSAENNSMGQYLRHCWPGNSTSSRAGQVVSSRATAPAFATKPARMHHQGHNCDDDGDDESDDGSGDEDEEEERHIGNGKTHRVGGPGGEVIIVGRGGTSQQQHHNIANGVIAQAVSRAQQQRRKQQNSKVSSPPPPPLMLDAIVREARILDPEAADEVSPVAPPPLEEMMMMMQKCKQQQQKLTQQQHQQVHQQQPLADANGNQVPMPHLVWDELLGMWLNTLTNQFEFSLN